MFRIILGNIIVFIFCFGLMSLSAVASPLQTDIWMRSYEKRIEMENYMNRSLNACENFYEYVSGNYGKYLDEASKDMEEWSPLQNVKRTMEQKVIEYLEDASPPASDVERKVKQFYIACENRPEDPSQYTDKLKELVREFGQMPALEGDNWRESEFDWAKVVAQINAKTNINIIMQIMMLADIFENSINRVFLMQPTLTFPKKVQYEDVLFEAARNIAIDKIQNNLQYYLNIDEQLAEQIAKEIFQFERALARGMQDLQVEDPDEVFNVTKIEYLQAQYLPAWNTIKQFAIVLDLYPTIVASQPIYLNNLAKVIQRTPKKQVANYIFYTYLNQYLKDFEIPCSTITRSYFKEYFENTMYHRHIKEEDELYIAFMWHEVKSAFEDTLKSNEVNWMSENTRKEALDKLQTMKFHIDAYEGINFTQKYSTLHLNDHNYMDNNRVILELRGKEARDKVIQPPKFEEPGADVLAYLANTNVVHFPVAYLLTSTLWSPSYPKAINFGSIATFIGHEMIHGFDDVSGKYDKNGNFRKWWDHSSTQKYRQRIACLDRQYRKYKFRGVRLNPLERQSENISDNVGVKQAYKAYLKWYNNADEITRKNEALPGFNFNHKQLFFLGYGQALGGYVHNDFVYDNDVHLPGELRMKGVLANMLEFSEAFKCPLGSPMNPIRKCKIFKDNLKQFKESFL